MDATLTAVLDAAKEYGVWPVVVLFLAWKFGPDFLAVMRDGWAAQAASQLKVADELKELGTRVIDRIDQQANMIGANTAAVAANTVAVQSLSKSVNGTTPKGPPGA